MMRFIVGQKQMNLSRLIVFALSAIVLISCGNKPSKLVAAPQLGNSGRTFADWCRQKADLSPETKHTVEVLLKIAGTTECDAANQKLSSLTALGLIDDNKISDIKPLASLTKLTRLSLVGTQIRDIKPLESLTNLKDLILSNNQINDIKPLESLTNLTVIGLNNNQISDIKPLESLTKLTVINLDNNQISDIKPLASLTKLNRLNLMGNPIALKTCPLKPESICEW